MGRSNDTSFAAFISPAMGPDGVPTGLDPFSAELGKNTGDADLSDISKGPETGSCPRLRASARLRLA